MHTSENKRRYERMLFNLETTTKDDFSDFHNTKTYPATVYTPKKRSLKETQHPQLKDIRALADFKCSIPFTLYHKRKEIIRTDPRHIQKNYKKIEDRERRDVQNTRPRVCMTPAVALDDVEEPARQVVVESMYSTSTNLMMQEGMAKILAKSKNIKSPLSEMYSPAKMVSLPPITDPFVSPEWRMDSVTWDARQLHIYVDPTKTF